MLIFTSAVMLVLMVLTSRSQSQRSRIIVMALVSGLVLAARWSRYCCRSIDRATVQAARQLRPEL
jgi:hypothetical protein